MLINFFCMPMTFYYGCFFVIKIKCIFYYTIIYGISFFSSSRMNLRTNTVIFVKKYGIRQFMTGIYSRTSQHIIISID